MKLAFPTSKDFWGGVMLIASGAAVLAIARDYPFGTALRMGPGYVPIVLGAILILFGLFLTARGLSSTEQVGGEWPVRPLVLLPLSLVLFAFLIQRTGFIPALVVLIFGSAAASTEFRFFEILLFSAVLTAFSVALFIWGLGLPYPLIVGI